MSQSFRLHKKIRFMTNTVLSSGQWGTSSAIVNTTGSTDYTCSGLQNSQSSTQNQPTQNLPPAQPADTKSHKHTPLIVGLIIGLGVPVVAGLAVLAWLHSRRKSKTRQRQKLVIDGTWDNQGVDSSSLPYSDDARATGGMQEIGASLLSTGGPVFAASNATVPALVNVTPMASELVHSDRGTTLQWIGNTSSAATTLHPATIDTPPSLTTQPSTSSSKALEALQEQSAASSSNSSSHTPDVSPQTSAGVSSAPGIIIQHQDGGVVELPPPYAGEYSGAATSSSLPLEPSAPVEKASTSP